MVKERSEVAQADTWDLSPMFADQDAWEQAFSDIQKKFWPEIDALKGKLGEGSDKVKKFLESSFGLEQELVRLYTYAHLRHDEDVANETHKNAHDRITALLYRYNEATAWADPEILSLPEEKLDAIAKADELKNYQTVLTKLLRLKPHTLSEREEELLALSGKSLETSAKTFSALNNADLEFPSVKTANGEEKELTHGLYGLYMTDRDRILRENAFKGLNGTFLKFENTCCALLSGVVEKHIFHAKARRYNSALEAALYPHQIDPSVYTNLVDTTREHLDVLHRYITKRKDALKVDKVHAYDLNVPLVTEVDMHFTYDEAVDITLEATKVLGPDYTRALEKGLKEQRWIDRYENNRKRSGAYSSGCYSSHPYILLNFQGRLNDVMTLAHEAGHSMHSYLSHQKQPYHYADYSIFVAEVASTFNEELVFRYLLERTSDPKEKSYLIHQKLDGIRGTFFRQTLFAEFEKQIHEMGEQGIPLTPATLRKAYRKLNEDYYGPDYEADEALEGGLMRVPHFYYNFYVYQYATGISAAFALVDKVLEEGPSMYLEFLSAGGSDYPLEVLKKAGVDMRQAEPIEAIIKRFDSLQQL